MFVGSWLYTGQTSEEINLIFGMLSYETSGSALSYIIMQYLEYVRAHENTTCICVRVCGFVSLYRSNL